MFVTSHVLAGRIIGLTLRRRPAAAFAAGIASHLLMDACPHWSPAEGPESQQTFLRVARRDGVVGLAALVASVASAPAEARWSVLGGVTGAALLDVDKPCLHFFGVNPFPRWCRRLHQRVQCQAPHRLPHELVAGTALALPLALATVRGRNVRHRRR